VAVWPLVGRLRGRSGASRGPGAPWRGSFAGVGAALLRQARAAHAVTLKARQHARVLCDRQWQ